MWDTKIKQNKTNPTVLYVQRKKIIKRESATFHDLGFEMLVKPFINMFASICKEYIKYLYLWHSNLR